MRAAATKEFNARMEGLCFPDSSVPPAVLRREAETLCSPASPAGKEISTGSDQWLP